MNDDLYCPGCGRRVEATDETTPRYESHLENFVTQRICPSSGQLLAPAARR